MPAITPWHRGDDAYIAGIGWISFPEYMKQGSRRTFMHEVAKFAPLAIGAVLVSRHGR